MRKNNESEFKMDAALKDQTISKFFSPQRKGEEGIVKAF